MKDKVIIVGIGETADIAYQYFCYDEKVEVVGFSVSQKYLDGKTSYHDRPLIALENLLEEYPPDDYKTFVAMSSGKLNRNRQHVYEAVKVMGYACVSYISPHAFVWPTAKIGENCFIFENNVIQHGVEVADNVVLWSGNHIGHQTKIADHVFVSSHCVISGFCEIGKNSFLGVKCTFADHIEIGNDCFIGMGAVVGKNMPANTLLKPAKSEISNLTAKQVCRVK